jgi:hypothetical protein
MHSMKGDMKGMMGRRAAIPHILFINGLRRDPDHRPLCFLLSSSLEPPAVPTCYHLRGAPLCRFRHSAAYPSQDVSQGPCFKFPP